MNTMSEAIRELADMDTLAAMDSTVHRRHPLAKLLVTVLYIFITVSFPHCNLSGLIPMVLYPVFLFFLSGIPISTCFYKLRFILPLICAVGIWNPILNRTSLFSIGGLTISAGMLSFLALLFKGIFALMASFLLIATTNIEKICYALSCLHLPDILVTQMLITYRYVSLLLKEAHTMIQAYSLRAPGQRGLHYSTWGSFVGQLLIRSMDRASRLYESMQMRGFHGSFYYANVEVWKMSDTLWVLLWTAFFVTARLFNLSVLLGRLFA